MELESKDDDEERMNGRIRMDREGGQIDKDMPIKNGVVIDDRC